MPSSAELLLLLWSSASIGWLAAAYFLVARRPRAGSGAAANPPSLSIFKPLPPLPGKSAPGELVRALASFVSQMDGSTELLIGIPQKDERAWKEPLAQLRLRHPEARIKTISSGSHSKAANPKIAWQLHLAPLAQGELWLWSDADILAPPGFLAAIRAELMKSGARALTCPYVVRAVPDSQALLDALFVNVEFFPGVLLLARRPGGVSFGLGAAILFYAEDFRRRADWERLGSTLADDNELGRQLAPVRVSRIEVETLPLPGNGLGGLAHYLRWHKTIRWCEPRGYACQLFILPWIGWLFAALASPPDSLYWAGLGAITLIEAALAWLLCRRIGCKIPIQWLWALLLWPALRAGAWIFSWMPAPVVWTGSKQRWWKLRKLELFDRT